MTALALLTAALAGWWLVSPVALARLRAVERPPPRAGRNQPVWAAPAVAGLLVGWLAGWGVGVALAVVAGTVSWVVRGHSRRQKVAERRAEVVRSCQLLGSLVRLGLVPAAALRSAAAEAPVLAEAAALQAMGGEVAPALRVAAAAPGTAGLIELAAAWEVAEATGASLAATVDAVADRLAADADLRATVEAELAAPRATGRLLAALPLAGLALGYLLGGDPVAFLTGSLAGQACLAAGAGLGTAGVVWTEVLADRHGG